MNILQAPLEATNMGWDADDSELCEYLVGVEWIDTRPREKAVWEKGMFANQNVVAKLRQPYTLQRLAEALPNRSTRRRVGRRNRSLTRRGSNRKFFVLRRWIVLIGGRFGAAGVAGYCLRFELGAEQLKGGGLKFGGGGEAGEGVLAGGDAQGVAT